MAGLAPLLEEILFRGLLYTAVERKTGSTGAVFISATAFALVHSQWFHSIPLFAMGVLLGVARRKTGSIWLAVSLHMLNNGASLAILMLRGG